jgi:DNA-binding LacI/PurR family transcriptional regulator
VEELISAIEGKEKRSTTIRIRPQLIVRESTGPCLVS